MRHGNRQDLSALWAGLRFFLCLALAVGAEGVANLFL